jgi:hypothetical protein
MTVKHIYLFFILLLSNNINAQVLNKDSVIIKLKKNYIGQEILGSPLKLNYGHFFNLKKSNIQVGFIVGSSLLPLLVYIPPSFSISFSIRKPIFKKLLVFGQAGVEWFSIIFPMVSSGRAYSNMKPNQIYVGGNIFYFSGNIGGGISYNYKRFLFTPFSMRLNRVSEPVRSGEQDYDNFIDPHFNLSFGMNINYQF